MPGLPQQGLLLLGHLLQVTQTLLTLLVSRERTRSLSRTSDLRLDQRRGTTLFLLALTTVYVLVSVLLARVRYLGEQTVLVLACEMGKITGGRGLEVFRERRGPVIVVIVLGKEVDIISAVH